MGPGSEAAEAGVDLATVRCVLRRHPIRTGVLFGSHVRGTNHDSSDVDVAVEFDPAVSDDERRQSRLDLIVDLSRTLGIDDVDVTDLDTIRPDIGASALEHGIVLVGDDERIRELRVDFARRMTERTHEERMERFDDALDSLEEKV